MFAGLPGRFQIYFAQGEIEESYCQSKNNKSHSQLNAKSALLVRRCSIEQDLGQVFTSVIFHSFL